MVSAVKRVYCLYLFSRTPELTSLGSFEKCWRLEEDGWWLYKLSPLDHLYSELCTFELYKLFHYPVAHYELLTEDPVELFGLSLSPGMGIIRTRDFTGGGAVNFEPAEALGLEDDDVLGNYQTLHAISPNLAGQYLDITVMDVLIYNLDRHTQNFGVLRDPDTGNILSMAPNFDNNLSLLAGIRGMGARSHSQDRLYQEWNRAVLAGNLPLSLPALEEAQIAEAVRGIDCPMDPKSVQLAADFILAGYRMVKNTLDLSRGPENGQKRAHRPER